MKILVGHFHQEISFVGVRNTSDLICVAEMIIPHWNLSGECLAQLNSNYQTSLTIGILALPQKFSLVNDEYVARVNDFLSIRLDDEIASSLRDIIAQPLCSSSTTLLQ